MLQKILLMLCSIALTSAGIIETNYSPTASTSYSSKFTPVEYIKTLQAPPVYESVVTTKESKYISPDGKQHSTLSKSFDTGYSSVNKFESKSSNDGDILTNTIPGYYSTSVHSPLVYHPHTSYTYSSPQIHTVSSPVYSKSVTVPVAYATHNVPLTNTIVSPSVTSYSTPLVSKTNVITSDLSSYSHPLAHTNAPAYTNSVSLPVTYSTHKAPLTGTIVAPTSYTTPVLSKSRFVTPGLSSYSSNAHVFEFQPIKTTLTYSEAPIVSHMSFTGLGTSYSW